MYLFQTAREELYRQIGRHRASVIGRVLDVGAGPSTRYRHLFKYSEYIQLDKIAHSAQHILGSADSLPFADDSFDSIVCIQVLGDVYDVEKVFQEFYRVLRRGGAALITEALFDPLHDEPYDYWRFTLHSLRRLAEDAGFVIETIEVRGGYYSVIAQMRARYWIERLDLYHTWYSCVASKLYALFGRYSIMRDRIDKSSANRLFTHGYLLIARKP